MPKVVVVTPTRAVPSSPYAESLKASKRALNAAGWTLATALEVGSPYISHARANGLRRALDEGADAVVFIDDDLSFPPDGILRLLQTPDEVVAGTYRFKREPEEYMGACHTEPDGRPLCRADGCIDMHTIPAGFLKVTRAGVNHFMRAFPELCFGEPSHPYVDLFNHGAWGGTWWGEDYAFARRWREKCGTVWLIPDLQIDHHTASESFPGNYHLFLGRQPGGALDPNRKP